jgi:UDPglucose 6-dehydrogenase
MSQATVGQVGYGFIGNAVVELFRPFCSVIVYDKFLAENGYEGREKFPRVTLCNDIDSVVKVSEIIFVAVPTPMRQSGECDTRIVESVVQDIQSAALRAKRDVEDFIVVIKSTVPPGFTRRMQDRYALRILFSPEFLTEANAVNDFKTTNRVLLGGDLEDARVVFKYFEGVWPTRIDGPNFDPEHPDGIVQIIQCEPEEAEMVKLSTNVHLTARVMISNELYLICQKMGIDYEKVKIMTQLDRRIGLSHMNVPGPDGHLGYGGHCFVKDTQSLAFISNQLGTAVGKSSLFHQLHLRNLEIRDDRDWEAQKGRAVSDD